MKTKLWSHLGVTIPFDPSCRFFTSWLLRPFFLFLIRALIATYCFATLVIRMIHSGSRSYQSFSYFTVLTYWGLAFYFLFASFHTFCYWRRQTILLHQWPKPFQFLHSLYYTTVITLPFLVTIVYWAVLAPPTWFPKTFDAWDNISVHAVNSLFALLEIILPRTERPPWLHLPFLVLILAGYLGVAYITNADQHFYVYAFLDPSKGSGRVAAYVFGILAAILVVFVAAWLAVWFRSRVTRKYDINYSGGSRLNGDLEMKSTI